MLRAIAIAFVLMAMASVSAAAQVQSCNPTTTGTNHPASPLHYLSAANDNATLVSGRPVAVCVVTAVNTTSTIYYLKLYNKATAPVCATDVPVQTYPVPFGTASSGNGFTLPLNTGLLFNLGLGFCLVGGIADNDDSNAATGIALNFGIK